MNDLCNGWHASGSDLATYADGGAQLLGRASIEAHLLACEHCRGALAELVSAASAAAVAAAAGQEPADDVDPVWARIADRIDVPRRPLRWSSGALRVSLSSPRLFAATAAVAAALLAVVAYVALADPAWSIPVLLALAPLAPVAGAAIAFRPAIDPAGTLAAATPLAGGRLPFLRAYVASVLALPAAVAAAAFTPLPWRETAVWMLPGAAMALIVVAAATWVDPIRIGGVLAVGWASLVVGWAHRERGRSARYAIDDLLSTSPAMRLVYLCVAVLAAATVVKRRDALPEWRSR